MKIRKAALAVPAVVLALSLVACGEDDEAPVDEGDGPSIDAAIVVESPAADATVSSPVTVSGTANVFEANVSIVITDEAGDELVSTFTTATCGSGCVGDFSEDVEFNVDEAGPGLITVFESSAEDGSRQNVVEIPVTLKPASEAQASGGSGSGTTITVGESQFGEVIFDGDEQAIYLFDIETEPVSKCYGECAEEWPPVLTKGEPQAKGPVKQGRLGTTERDDGTTQVTYNGHPLYYYAHEGPGIVACHNVPGFGGLWLALDAAGNPL